MAEPQKPGQEAADEVFTTADDGIMKILLLGAGEAGKSTILKQLQMLYEQKLDPVFYRQWLCRNSVTSARGLVEIAQSRSMEVDAGKAEIILGLDDGEVPSEEGVKAIEEIWATGVLQTAYDMNQKDPKLWLPDHAVYYISQIRTFIDTKFVPTHSQMLLTRSLTAGVNAVGFSDQVDGAYLLAHCPVAAQMLGTNELPSDTKLDWEVIDVGGQRAERKKWMEKLKEALGLIFTVGLPEYAQVLYEDPDTIRMQESLDLFKMWANHKDFARKPVVIAFTKKDLFASQFNLEKFKNFYKDFETPEGSDEEIAKAALEHIKNSFKNLLENKRKKLETFFINTTDKDDFRDMLEGLKEIVAKHNNAKIMDVVQKAVDEANAKKPGGGKMSGGGGGGGGGGDAGGGCCTVS